MQEIMVFEESEERTYDDLQVGEVFSCCFGAFVKQPDGTSFNYSNLNYSLDKEKSRLLFSTDKKNTSILAEPSDVYLLN